MGEKTLQAPAGGEVFLHLNNGYGRPINLTYNDLWALLICRTACLGDWAQTFALAANVPDGRSKQAIVERLWALENDFGELPPIPPAVEKLHLSWANAWFNTRSVSESKNW